MFKKDNRYVTRGVNEEVDIRLQLIMWSMIDKLNYPSKGYVSIDSNTGIWRYTAKVGLTGLDEFTIRITTISGNEINSVISINLLDSICCQCRNKINTCVTIM